MKHYEAGGATPHHPFAYSRAKTSKENGEENTLHAPLRQTPCACHIAKSPERILRTIERMQIEWCKALSSVSSLFSREHRGLERERCKAPLPSWFVEC